MDDVTDITIAFVMDCDRQNLSYEAGIRAAYRLADELVLAAEDRDSYARREAQDE